VEGQWFENSVTFIGFERRQFAPDHLQLAKKLQRERRVPTSSNDTNRER